MGDKLSPDTQGFLDSLGNLVMKKEEGKRATASVDCGIQAGFAVVLKDSRSHTEAFCKMGLCSSKSQHHKTQRKTEALC
jgi:hypothetical protein